MELEIIGKTTIGDGDTSFMIYAIMKEMERSNTKCKTQAEYDKYIQNLFTPKLFNNTDKLKIGL